MRIFEKYTRAEYEDYYDFKKNFRINAPETFNFAYDVMDVLAEEKPDKNSDDLAGNFRRRKAVYLP